ncbi:serine/threonine-protein kinase [Streptomyces sp. CRN 30]|uniref:serine/threonine-protein kinase n=1 Tax=Streptomyces sp. CRN 30 TaxID=3075613 RepID=UPI002A7FB23E|nr:protein kinase [Streptomyces sp. CRN 30]
MTHSGVGRVIAGRYLLLNRLGSGGMGHVWLAHDQQLVCEVALKEIVFRDHDESDRPARIARARAEARHAAGLRDHPHVVTVHDVLEHEGLPWIVMEYVPGATDLRTLVGRHGPLAPAESARIGLAVLDALTAGHERGVMHRDVKPANILLAPDRNGTPYARVLLADYGISVQPDGDETRYTLTSALLGTAGYLAPERAQGGPPTAAADLFSLGCTLYHAVEGCGPFERDSDLAALTAVVLEEPRPTRRAGALDAVLARMLTKDPVRRITAEGAEERLSAIVTPRSPARPAADPESRPPWADLSTRTADPRGPAGFGPAPGAPWYGAAVPVPPPAPAPYRGGHRTGDPLPPAAPPGRPRRTRTVLLVLAGVLALALAGGGALWLRGLLPDTGHYTGGPYGKEIGLASALHEGDCVNAVWPGTPFTGKPEVKLVECVSQDTDGEVMALVAVAGAEEAAERGPGRCEERTAELRDRLADVRSYAVLPTAGGFEAAGRRVACLVLGASRPVYGPLGEHRPLGMRFTDTATMQKRDCLDWISEESTRLVSCAGPHEEQVLDFTLLDPELTYEAARTKAPEACRDKVDPIDYGFDPSVHESGFWISRNDWKTSTHFAVCTVRARDGGTMEGDQS